MDFKLIHGVLGSIVCGVGFVPALCAVDIGEIEINGFASIGYLKSSDNNYLGKSKQGSFEFNEFGLSFRTKINDKTHFGIQFFSRDLGELGNNDINIDWAFLDHHINDRIGIRIGRVKMPGALYNEYQDIDAVRPNVLMPQGVYNLNFRDVLVAVDGIAAYGNLKTEKIGDFDYNFYIGTVPIKEDGSVIREFEDVGISDPESDLHYSIGGNITWNTPLDGLRLAYSYQMAHDWEINGFSVVQVPAGPGFTKLYVPVEFKSDELVIQSASVEYTRNDWIFAAEYQLYDGEFKNPAQTFPVVWGAWYLQASYELNEKWQFSTYYMEFLEDVEDTDGSKSTPDHAGWQKDFTVSARYNVNDSWNLKAEVHFIDGTGLLTGLDGNDPSETEENWTLFALKSTISF